MVHVGFGIVLGDCSSPILVGYRNLRDPGRVCKLALTMEGEDAKHTAGGHELLTAQALLMSGLEGTKNHVG